jgi:hypothetical protein
MDFHEAQVPKPLRKPDLSLPQEKDFFSVDVWVAEKVFRIDGVCFNHITSYMCSLPRETDPMIYIDALARSHRLEGTERQRLAREFLFNIELTLLLST